MSGQKNDNIPGGGAEKPAQPQASITTVRIAKQRPTLTNSHLPRHRFVRIILISATVVVSIVAIGFAIFLASGLFNYSVFGGRPPDNASTGSLGDSSATVAATSAIASDGTVLSQYEDATYHFSVSMPASWSVTVGESIRMNDSADGGSTNVQIQPVFLSGRYRYLSASQVANYLIGKRRIQYEGFTVERVRESGDGRFLELQASFTEAGALKKVVYTIFVNQPYVMLSSYESSDNLFSTREPLMRSIASSFRQFTPPDTVEQAQDSASMSSIGELRETFQDNRVKILLPDGWTAHVLQGCSGLLALDGATPARGVVFLNGLHQSIQPLPVGTTPEVYLTDILPQDFPDVTNMHLIGYEDGDVSGLTNGGGTDVKVMRCTFMNKGEPAMGIFLVGTYGTSVSTAVAMLWGVYSPQDQFEQDKPTLVRIFTSIDYSSSSLDQCRGALNASWAAANRTGETIRRNGEQMRQENLQLYQEKQDRNDEFLEKYSDYILNRERVYNPETNEVYHVDQDFYRYYDLHRDEFRDQDMRELQPGEWLAYTPLDGNLRVS